MTSGCNHGKTFVSDEPVAKLKSHPVLPGEIATASDDKIATVGTTNLDFRRLYLHFECGVLVYHCDTVMTIKEDFLRTVPVSHQVSLAEYSGSAFHRIIPDLLRIFAPLM
jgi:hypothetical protein